MSAIVTILSTVASITGVVAVFPQLWIMHKHKNSSSQSNTGWQLSAATNLSLLLVNLTAYKAYLLASGNLISLLGSLLALWLIKIHRKNPPPADRPYVELQTNELHDLHYTVVREYANRSKPLPVAPPPFEAG